MATRRIVEALSYGWLRWVDLVTQHAAVHGSQVVLILNMFGRFWTFTTVYTWAQVGASTSWQRLSQFSHATPCNTTTWNHHWRGISTGYKIPFLYERAVDVPEAQKESANIGRLPNPLNPLALEAGEKSSSTKDSLPTALRLEIHLRISAFTRLWFPRQNFFVTLLEIPGPIRWSSLPVRRPRKFLNRFSGYFDIQYIYI